MILKKLFKPFLVIFFIAAMGQAFAVNLSDVKSQGLVGEQVNGYLGLVKPGAPADVVKLAKEVNGKRKAIYIKLSQQKKVPLKEIEKVAGTRNLSKTSAGHYIKDASGTWKKK